MPEDRIEQRRDGNVEFLAAEPDDLDRVVSVPQAFDNQWVPDSVLQAALTGRSRPSDDKIEAERRPHVRREYLRALVNTGQVVINRAFLYNNPALYQDYVRPGRHREEFKQLIGNRIVVPYLFAESSPAEQPIFTSRDGWQAWSTLIQEVAPMCLRLSWESDEINSEMARRELSRRSNEFIRNLRELNAAQLAADFELPPGDAPELRTRLIDVVRWAQQRELDDQPINREDVYSAFVVAEDTKPGDRQYDPGKPFGAQIKQLIDLRYNANLADALDSYMLSPEDSLRRRALQELAQRDKGTVDADIMARAVASLRFDQITEVLGAPAAFEKLTLGSVLELRSTGAWLRYHDVLQDFLAVRSPAQTLETFGDSDHGAEAVARAYRDVIREAGPIAARHATGDVVERWDPKVEMMVEFAGAIISIFFNPGGNGLNFYSVVREIMPGIATRSAKAVFHLVIGRATRSRGEAQVENSLRVLDTKLEAGRKDWQDFQVALQARGFRRLDSIPGRPEDVAAMERGDAE